MASGYLALWLLLDRASRVFQISPEVSIWYPPVGLDAALLVGFGLRYLPLPMLANVLHNLLIDPRPYSLTDYLIPILGGNLVYALAAWLLLRYAHIGVSLPGLHDVRWFLLGMAFLAPALAGMLQSLGFVLNAGIGADQWFAVFSSFWAGDAAGVTAIAPLVLHLLGWSRHKWGVVAVVSRNWLRGQEGLVTLAQWAVLLMGIWIAFAAPLSGDLNYQYMVFVPLVLFAVQRGYTGSLVAVLTINVAILFLDRKTPTTQNI